MDEIETTNEIKTTQETEIVPAPDPSSDAPAPSAAAPAAGGAVAVALAWWARARAVVQPLWARIIAWRDNQKLLRRLSSVKHLRLIFVVIFLVAFVAPLLTLGATALVQYNQLKGWGQDGINQLTSLKDLLPTSTTKDSGSTSSTVDKAKDILNPTTLNTIKQHCLTAQSDFAHINSAIANREGIIGIALATPYRAKIEAVQQLAIIGIDGTVLCDKLTTVGKDFTNSFKTSPFSSTGGPILTAQSFADLQQGVDDAQLLLTDINTHLQATNLNELPVSKKQLSQVQTIANSLPKYLSDIATFKPYIPLAGWALGVDQTRHYLIQTMDRGELRPSGGFNGQWGVLSINGGRIGQLSLADVTFVDFTSDNGIVLEQPTPVQYADWFPFAPYGMRDADLSGDFPTSAQMIMKTFIKEETASGSLHNPDVLGPGGSTLDGDIHFAPIVIARLLDPQILGPITIPCYNETVTESNLEAVLHKYQEDPSQSIIDIQNKCSPTVNGTSLRKRFTSTLATALQNRVRSATQAQLLAILKSLKDDLATKDLEVYVTNTDIQSLLATDHLDGSLNRNPKIDGTSIVQMNIGVNKQSTTVVEKVNESVALDANGNAFHDLTMSFSYNPTHFYSTESPDYRDYIRIYVPSNAVYDGGSGFDENTQPVSTFTQYPVAATPLCVKPKATPPPAPPPAPTPTAPGKTPTPIPPAPTPTPLPPGQVAFPCSPDEAPSCAGQFMPQDQYDEWSPSFLGGSQSTVTDKFGEPTNFASDEPGRAMFGGLLVLPPNCATTLEVQWHVPNIGSKASAKSQTYTIEIQRQSGTNPVYDLQVQPADGVKESPLNIKIASLDQDVTFTLQPTKK